MDKKRVLIAFTISIFGFIIETIGGYFFTRSLSLSSDGVHMASHGLAFAFVYQCLCKPEFELRSAKFVGIILIGISLFIFGTACWRLNKAVEISTQTMLMLASIGLLLNFAQLIVLHPTDRKKTSLRGFFWHVLADTGMSVIIIIGGLAMYFTNFYRLDTYLTFLFAPVIFLGGVKLIRDCGKQCHESHKEHH